MKFKDCYIKENIFEDGFMKHKEDIKGLLNYLIDLKILKPGDTLHNAANKDTETPLGPNDYLYVIDLDERGVFKAHVDDSKDKTVWEYNSEKEDEVSEEDK